MRSSCSQGVRPRAGQMIRQPSKVVSTCPTAASMLCRLNSQNSSSDSSTAWSGCSPSHARATNTVKCSSAAGSSHESDFGPQKPAGSKKEGKSSSWGTGWSKRSSSGSVFKKQPLKGKLDQQQHIDGSSEGSSAAAGSAAEQIDPQLEVSIRMNVERANQTLQDIVQEVLGELLVEEASAYVLGQEEADLQLNQAVRGAVVNRLEWLDSNFLAAVNAFLAVPGVRSNPELTVLLSAVRQETLRLVSARLPPPVQVLNAALAHSRRAGRDDVMQQALGGGKGDVPGTNLDALGAAAHQLIDDMEDQQVVADRVLLARLVLIREELRALAERQSSQSFWQPDGSTAQADMAAAATADSSSNGSSAGSSVGGSSSSQPFFAFHRSNLPARCAAFLKNLLTVQDRNQRLGLLAKTFQEDWIAESQPAAAAAVGPDSSSSSSTEAQPSFSQQRAATRDTNFGPGAHNEKQEAPDTVRPGRLLTTLHAMRQELEVQLVSAGYDTPAGAEALQLLRRLEDIRIESLVALDRLQHSRPADGSLGSSSSSSSSVLDYECELEEHDAALQAVAN